jgi:hypothetical protein
MLAASLHILRSMLDAVGVGLLLLFPLIGAITRRWLAVALPLVAWPLFYAGLSRGWWLHELDTEWEIARTVFTIVGVVSTAVAVLVAGLIRPPTKRLLVNRFDQAS